MNYHLILAVVLAALLPAALVITGVELRRVRLRIVQDLQNTVFREDPNLPQLLLARARYDRATQQMPRGEGGSRLSGPPMVRFGRQDEVKYYFGATIYTLICTGGFILLFVPVKILFGATTWPLNIPEALFWLPEILSGIQNPDAIRRTAAIAGIAFLGGYIFNVRYLIRQTLNQELSALAFVRAGLGLVQGVVIAVAVYHVGATILPGESDAGMAVALGAAFTLGYFPDIGISRIAQIARIHIKAVDKNALEKARIVPLEIVDGIDHEIAFRLQESNLFDVQNLAVANPIEIYAETPYTLLQVFDWVLQAQLCLVAGVDAFNELKRHKIRTIFDLERAMLASGVPDRYLRALAAVLLCDASDDFRKAIGLPVDPAQPDATGEVVTLVIRHIVAIVSDDLHVHRLRALWRAIMETTAGTGNGNSPIWLFETDPLPGDPPRA